MIIERMMKKIFLLQALINIWLYIGVIGFSIIRILKMFKK